MWTYLTILLKLVLSIVLGALIGFERENKNMPAGLRTNILVCMGAALVQMTSIDIFNQYHGIVNVDPARLGAQVISGIGFLGAGTIIREGASIKGLTTAAGLWVVACIGLAIGNGSYITGIFGAVLAYLTLHSLKAIENKFTSRSPYLDIEIEIDNKPGEIGRIGQYLGSMNINIKSMEFAEYEGERIHVFLSLKLPSGMSRKAAVEKIMNGEGVHSVEEK